MLLTKADTPHTFESQPFIWQCIPLQLGSTFDCLRFVMSVMVAAPAWAIKREFCFPLLAVYRKWCVALAGSQRRGPTRTFIASDDEGVGPQVALGSNIGGGKTLKPAVQLDRLNWTKEVTPLNLPEDLRISVERPTVTDMGALFWALR